jgi:DNA topoisomerase-1
MDDEAGENIIDARDAAESVGLVYVSDQEPGKAKIERINKIGVPPAYVDVWICADERGHIQATGRDAKGRKQYRYHERFREVRDSTKYEHMLTFAQVLPGIRERIDADMSRRGLPREKILATVVHQTEQELWPDHAQRQARQGRRRQAALSFQGKERQGVEPESCGPSRREDR